MYSPKRRFRLFRHPAWSSGGVPTPPSSSSDILTLSRSLATTYTGINTAPIDAGPLTINSQSVGNYEITTRSTNTTISSFTASDWFTNTKDTTSSWIVVNGNLTINAGQTIIPPVRKLFTVLYVTGNLVCNGSISMTGRGANHSGTGDSGGATTAVAIRVGTGTFGAVTNPQIPATGGSGAAGTSVDNAVVSGNAGTNGGTGGGGAGGRFSAGTSGGGATGTCFSGGPGGGGAISAGTAGTGGANGGKGGDSIGIASGGGTGNPGGTKGGVNGLDGNSGTGGTLIIIVGGTLSGTGTITANGVDGIRPSGAVAGGASGGGSVTVLYGTDSSSITPTATGGSGVFSGNGGNGTGRKLAIGAN